MSSEIDAARLFAFVSARAAEDEAIADAAAGAGPMGPEHAHWKAGYGMLVDADDPDWAITTETLDEIVQHFARNDPARMRRRVAAVRAVLAAYEMSVRMLGEGLSRDKLMLVRAHAVIWEDHPDYDEAWRPA